MPRSLGRCRGPDLNWGHRNFQSRALPTELPRHIQPMKTQMAGCRWPGAGLPSPRDKELPATNYLSALSHQSNLSGRWDSNPRPSPWQGDVLPLNYTRKPAHRYRTDYIRFRHPVKLWRFACDDRPSAKRSLGERRHHPPRVDPAGFEPAISSVQGRRLPARPRAQVDCELRIANFGLSGASKSEIRNSKSHWCRREDLNLHAQKGSRS